MRLQESSADPMDETALSGATNEGIRARGLSRGMMDHPRNKERTMKRKRNKRSAETETGPRHVRVGYVGVTEGVKALLGQSRRSVRRCPELEALIEAHASRDQSGLADHRGEVADQEGALRLLGGRALRGRR